MENNVTVTKSEELQLMEARAAAEFAITPIGMMVKNMEAISKVAEYYAKTDFVPVTFKGKPENCAIAIDMATRMNMNPIMVMQNMYVVHGQPSLSSKLIIAMINNCGQFEPLRFEHNGKGGDEFAYRAWTYRKSDVKHEFRLEGTWITAAMVKAEGWGQKWKTMPEQMYKYRAAVFWARTNAPEVTMGLLTREEVEEPGFVSEVEETQAKTPVELAMEEMKKKRKKADAPIAPVVTEPQPQGNPAIYPEPQGEKEASEAQTRGTQVNISPTPFDEPEEAKNAENGKPKAGRTLV